MLRAVKAVLPSRGFQRLIMGKVDMTFVVAGSTVVAEGAVARQRLISRTLREREPEDRAWRTFCNLAAFVIPALSWCEISWVGRLFLSDILLIIAFPLALSRAPAVVRSRATYVLFILGLLWLANQVLTDLIRGTSVADFARGWAKIGLTTANILTLSVILNYKRRRFVLYAIGIGVGALIAAWVNPGPWFWTDNWKFGYSTPFCVAIALFATILWSRELRTHALIVILIGACIHAFLGTRALAGVTFVAAGLLFVRARQTGRRPILMRKVVFAVSLLALVSFAFLKMYEVMAKQGLFGELLRAKVEAQTSGDKGMLVGGRGLVFAALVEIAGSPLIGIGSWQEDTEHVMQMAIRLREYGYSMPDHLVKTNSFAASHSHIFGSWVEAGLLGAVFWSTIIWSLVRQLLRVPWRYEPLAPLIVLTGFRLLWDILFSPFAQEARFVVPYSILLVLMTRQFTGSRRPSHKLFVPQSREVSKGSGPRWKA